MVAEVRPDYKTESAAMAAVAQKLGIGSRETLRNRVRQAEIDAGHHQRGSHAGQGVEEGDRRASQGERDPQSGREFLRGRARPATSALVAFIDEHRDRFGGLELICRVLTMHDCSIAPSTSYAFHQRQAAPSARTLRDEELKPLIQEVYDSNYQVYGARKIWRELHRRGHPVARCTIERLMRQMGLAGAVRGKKIVTTTADLTAVRAPDLVDRDFVVPAPNRCWVADFTHVAAWAGVVYVAFVVDTFSRRIVGWAASTSKQTRLVLDALEMGLRQRDRDGRPHEHGSLVHHSDAGSQGGFNWPNTWKPPGSPPPSARSATPTTMP